MNDNPLPYSGEPLSLDKFMEFLKRDLTWLEGASMVLENKSLITKVQAMLKNYALCMKGLNDAGTR